jgi:hypothetical protein
MADIRCSYHRESDGTVVVHLMDGQHRMNGPGPVYPDGNGRLWLLSVGDEETGAFLKPLDRHPDLLALHVDNIAQEHGGSLTSNMAQKLTKRLQAQTSAFEAGVSEPAAGGHAYGIRIV